jgi:hypothetical protein
MRHLFRVRHAVDGIDFDPDQMHQKPVLVCHASTLWRSVCDYRQGAVGIDSKDLIVFSASFFKSL